MHGKIPPPMAFVMKKQLKFFVDYNANTAPIRIPNPLRGIESEDAAALGYPRELRQWEKEREKRHRR
jgi:hypothetical protein